MKTNSKYEFESSSIITLFLLIVAFIAILIIVVPHGKNENELVKGQTATGEQNETTNNNQQQIKQKIEIAKINGSGEKVNTSEKVNFTKETEEFTFSNVSLKETNGETVLSARMTNKSGTKQAGFFGNIVLLNEANNEIGKIPLQVSEMNINETREISASIMGSYVNVYDYKIEK